MSKIEDLYREKFLKLNSLLGKLSYYNAAEGDTWIAETKSRYETKDEVLELTTDLVSLGVTKKEFSDTCRRGLFRQKDIFTSKSWDKINDKK